MRATLDPIRLLAQADLLLLLAELLGPPEGWGDQAAESELEALAGCAGLDRVPGGAIALKRALLEMRALGPTAVKAERNRLFDGAQICPPNETAYVRRDKGALLSDIAGFYRAFGFDLVEEVGEKHDHIVAELQFAALLLVQLGRAVEAGNAEHIDVARNALEHFAQDHLGVWIEVFTRRLEELAPPAFGSLAILIRAAWSAVGTSVDVSATDTARELVPQETGTPYECGLCGQPPGNA